MRHFPGEDPAYSTISRLGQGGFGTVFKVRRRSDGRIMAKKIIKVTNSTMPSVEAELRALEALRGSGRRNHIVTYHSDVGVDQRTTSVHLHMDLYKCDLAKKISDRQRQRQKFTETEVLRILKHIATALDHCHSKSIIHRDIKPQNILLDDTNAAFVTDFGIGRFLNHAGPLNETRNNHVHRTNAWGTDIYMPEEAYRGSIGAFTDIFGFGCLAYELVEGRRAYNGRSKRNVPGVTASGYSSGLKRLIESCLAYEYRDRPSTSRLLRETTRLGESAPVRADPSPRARRPEHRAERPQRRLQGDRQPRPLIRRGISNLLQNFRDFGRRESSQPSPLSPCPLPRGRDSSQPGWSPHDRNGHMFNPFHSPRLQPPRPAAPHRPLNNHRAANRFLEGRRDMWRDGQDPLIRYIDIETGEEIDGEDSEEYEEVFRM